MRFSTRVHARKLRPLTGLTGGPPSYDFTLFLSPFAYQIVVSINVKSWGWGVGWVGGGGLSPDLELRG